MVLLNSVRTMVTVFGVLSQCLWKALASKLCYEARNSSFNFDGEPNYLNINYAFSLSSFKIPKILELSNTLLSMINFYSSIDLPGISWSNNIFRVAIICLNAVFPSFLNDS